MKFIAKNNKGFTLIEVFLAASLLSMVLVSIFAAYTAGIRVWRTVREIDGITDRRIFTAVEKMRREIYGYIREFKDVEFEGDEKTLTFPAVSGDSIIEVNYTYNPGKDALMREVSKFSESLKESSKTEETKLFDAKRVRFSYLYPEESEEGLGGWTDSFEASEEGVPQAIKMDIKKMDGEKDTKIIFMP